MKWEKAVLYAIVLLMNFLLGGLYGAWGTIKTSYSLMFSGAIEWIMGIGTFFVIFFDIALILAIEKGNNEGD